MKNLCLFIMVCCFFVFSNIAEAKNLGHNIPAPEIDIHKALDIADKHAAQHDPGIIKGRLYAREASYIGKAPAEPFWVIAYSDSISDRFYVIVHTDGKSEIQTPR